MVCLALITQIWECGTSSLLIKWYMTFITHLNFYDTIIIKKRRSKILKYFNKITPKSCNSDDKNS